MKKNALLKVFGLFAIGALALSSCGSKLGEIETKEDFVKVEQELKSKFGENAYFTKLSISGGDGKGYASILVEVTNDPASLKLEEWAFFQGKWDQKSNITLELSNGNPQDFMLSLSELNLTKMGELVEASKKMLATEKSVSESRVDMVSIKTPDDAPKSESYYSIFLEPKNGGTSFRFSYSLQGELTSFDY